MLLQTIQNDLVIAMKEKNEIAKQALRQVVSAVKNEAIALRHELTFEEEHVVLAREIKRLKETIAECEKAGRTDLSEAAEHERVIISKYMPVQSSDDEIVHCIKNILTQFADVSSKDTGKIMSLAMKELKGKADGVRVREMVSRLVEGG